MEQKSGAVVTASALGTDDRGLNPAMELEVLGNS
jgi:hypothetical protein